MPSTCWNRLQEGCHCAGVRQFLQRLVCANQLDACASHAATDFVPLPRGVSLSRSGLCLSLIVPPMAFFWHVGLAALCCPLRRLAARPRE